MEDLGSMATAWRQSFSESCQTQTWFQVRVPKPRRRTTASPVTRNDRRRQAASMPALAKSAHPRPARYVRSEEHTSELQSPCNLVCRLLLEKKKKKKTIIGIRHKTSDDTIRSSRD